MNNLFHNLNRKWMWETSLQESLRKWSAGMQTAFFLTPGTPYPFDTVMAQYCFRLLWISLLRWFAKCWDSYIAGANVCLAVVHSASGKFPYNSSSPSVCADIKGSLAECYFCQVVNQLFSWSMLGSCQWQPVVNFREAVSLILDLCSLGINGFFHMWPMACEVWVTADHFHCVAVILLMVSLVQILTGNLWLCISGARFSEPDRLFLKSFVVLTQANNIFQTTVLEAFK